MKSLISKVTTLESLMSNESVKKKLSYFDFKNNLEESKAKKNN